MRNLLTAVATLAAALVAAMIATSPASAYAESGTPVRVDRYDASGMPLNVAPATAARPALAARTPARPAPAVTPGDAQAVQLAYSRPPRYRRHGRYRRPPPRRFYRPYAYRPYAYRYPRYYGPPPVYRRRPRCVTRIVRYTPRGRVVRVVPGCGPRGRRYWRY